MAKGLGGRALVHLEHPAKLGTRSLHFSNATEGYEAENRLHFERDLSAFMTLCRTLNQNAVASADSQHLKKNR